MILAIIQSLVQLNLAIKDVVSFVRTFLIKLEGIVATPFDINQSKYVKYGYREE